MRPSPRRSRQRITREVLKASFVDGLLLPFRLFFQPQAVLEKYARLPNRSDLQLWLIYGFSLVWVLLIHLICLVVFGLYSITASSILISAGFMLFGAIRAIFWTLQQGRAVDMAFDYPLAVAIGVVLNGGIVIYSAFLNATAYNNGSSIAVVADRAFQSIPFLCIVGIVCGLVIAILFGTRGKPRDALLVGLIFGGFLVVAFTVFSRSTEMRQYGFALFLPATLVTTHLLFQPLYFAISLITTLLITRDSTLSPPLWRISPAHWSEFAYVPLVGLPVLLTSYYRTEPTAGLRAINRVKHHPFYKRVGERVSKEIYRPRPSE